MQCGHGLSGAKPLVLGQQVREMRHRCRLRWPDRTRLRGQRLVRRLHREQVLHWRSCYMQHGDKPVRRMRPAERLRGRMPDMHERRLYAGQGPG